MIKFQLEQKPSLKLKITPSIIIQLKLITLPIHELEEQIKNEASENPFIEIEYETGENNLKTTINQDESPNSDLDSISETPSEFGIQGNEVFVYSDEEEKFYYDNYIANFSQNEDLEKIIEKTPENIEGYSSIDEKVIPQIYSKFSDEKEILIAERIFWSLDEKGYLTKSLEEIKKELEEEGISTTEEEIESVRKKFMELDPPGLGSKNPEEYFLFMLSKILNQDEFENIREKIEEIKEKRKNQQKKDEGIYDLNSEIFLPESEKILLPKDVKFPLFPTFEFLRSEIISIPKKVDLHVFKDKGEIYIIPERTLKVRLSEWQKESWYREAKKNIQKEKREILEELLQRARNYVDGMRKREDLLLKVAKAIFSYQEEFLEKGETDKIKPLTLEDLEKMCGISKSTIDRAIANKYVKTPYGIFELKKFLSRGFNKGEIKVSREAILNEIKKLIANEDPENPLSDSSIAKKIKEKFNIEISRRTVVKYRKILGIPQLEKRIRKKV
jgi:RNA polymerase sigma-54 factor